MVTELKVGSVPGAPAPAAPDGRPPQGHPHRVEVDVAPGVGGVEGVRRVG
jgi:hypothetical protein